MTAQKLRLHPTLAPAALVALVALLAVVGAVRWNGSTPDGAGKNASTAVPAGPPDVLRLDGLRGITFGASEQELTRRGVLMPETAPCSPRLTGLATVSPVFHDDRLVLLWASPPMRTPEGISVGTPVGTVRDTYPEVIRLDAPRGSYRFDGLLARDGDRAYLFLHDGRKVRKIIAGYAEYARKLFDEGFGTC